MDTVIAVSDGPNVALKLSRPDLAKNLAVRELDRIRNRVESPAAEDPLAELYACVTLCGGLERNKAIGVADREFAAAQIASLARQPIDVITPLLPLVASHAATQTADGFSANPAQSSLTGCFRSLRGLQPSRS